MSKNTGPAPSGTVVPVLLCRQDFVVKTGIRHENSMLLWGLKNQIKLFFELLTISCGVFLKKNTQSTFEKSRKMIRVTLRYTWITWAMFMGPWSGARPPIREAIVKKCIHITWIVLLDHWQKHTVRCVLFKKKDGKNKDTLQPTLLLHQFAENT